MTITGTVTARKRALTRPTVRVVLGEAAIRDRAAVRDWMADTSDPSGPELAGTATTGPLPPGRSAPCTLTNPKGSLSPDRPWGGIPAAINPELTQSEIDYLRDDLKPSIVLLGDDVEALKGELAVDTPHAVAADPMGTAAIVYTSVTTCSPKGVIVRHGA